MVNQQIDSISIGERERSSGNQEQCFQLCYAEGQLPDHNSEQCNESVSLLELVSDSNSSETLGLERSAVEPVAALYMEGTSTATSTDDVCPGPSCLPSNAATSTTRVEAPDHEGELNYISKYLIQYVPVKKTHKASKRATGARVLTNDECSKCIFEQEEKKKKREKTKISTEG